MNIQEIRYYDWIYKDIRFNAASSAASREHSQCGIQMYLSSLRTICRHNKKVRHNVQVIIVVSQGKCHDSLYLFTTVSYIRKQFSYQKIIYYLFVMQNHILFVQRWYFYYILSMKSPLYLLLIRIRTAFNVHNYCDQLQ